MRSLPLFHRIAGQPVIVLGEGPMAEAKRQLVERAGGMAISCAQEGIAQGARLAFVAHADPVQCTADAGRLKAAGLLVNAVDQPDVCDFTTPSILDRDPVLIAVGTAGASAGLAKQLRLRLETLLPADLGQLATRLYAVRSALRERFPQATARRQALDAALTAGGALDPLEEGASAKVDDWLAQAVAGPRSAYYPFTLTSDDPEDLTLRQARVLGCADTVFYDPGIPQAILQRARADAVKVLLPHGEPVPDQRPAGVTVRLDRSVPVL